MTRAEGAKGREHFGESRFQWPAGGWADFNCQPGISISDITGGIAWIWTYPGDWILRTPEIGNFLELWHIDIDLGFDLHRPQIRAGSRQIGDGRGVAGIGFVLAAARALPGTVDRKARRVDDAEPRFGQHRAEQRGTFFAAMALLMAFVRATWCRTTAGSVLG